MDDLEEDLRFQADLVECEEFAASVGKALGTMPADTPRRILAFSFMAVALEHFDGMTELLQDRRFAVSASALVRPLMDSCFRSLWLALLATDEEIIKIAAGTRTKALEGSPPAVYKLLEAKFALADVDFFSSLRRDWGALSGYVHTDHIQAWNKLSTIRSKKFPFQRGRSLLLRGSSYLTFGVGFVATAIPDFAIASMVESAHHRLQVRLTGQDPTLPSAPSWVN